MSTIDEFQLDQEWINEEAQTIRSNEEARSRALNRRDINYVKIDVGDNVFRFLPPLKSPGRICKVMYYHNNINSFSLKFTPTSASLYRILCPSKSFPKSGIVCDVCAAIEEVKKYTTPKGRTYEVDMYQSRLRAHSCVVKKDAKNHMADCREVGMLELGVTVYNWVIMQVSNPRIGNIAHPYTGFDVTIRRVGEKLDTEYTPSFVPMPCKLHEDDNVIKEILANRYDLDEIFHEPDERYTEMTYATGAAIRGKLIPGRMVSRGNGDAEPRREPRPATHTRPSTSPPASSRPTPSVTMAPNGQSPMDEVRAPYGSPPECYQHYGEVGVAPASEVCDACPWEVQCKEETVPF